jgi:septum formation protein
MQYCAPDFLELQMPMKPHAPPHILPLTLALILASGSRFRKRMLENAGLVFEVIPASVDEPRVRQAMTEAKLDISPGEIALKLAALKALDVSAKHPAALVIGSDQVLAFDGEIFGKPSDLAAARRQLGSLAGRQHRLPTGVVLAQNGKVIWEHLGVATLTMRPLSEAFLDAYLSAEGHVLTETVGGYQLEGRGAQLFERIEGDYFTIIGLPLLPLLGELRRRGVLEA